MDNPNSKLDPQNPMHRLAHQTTEELNQFHDENIAMAIESQEEQQKIQDEVDYQSHQDKIQNEIDIASHEGSQKIKSKPEDTFIEEDSDRLREKQNDYWADQQEQSDPGSDW